VDSFYSHISCVVELAGYWALLAGYWHWALLEKSEAARVDPWVISPWPCVGMGRSALGLSRRRRIEMFFLEGKKNAASDPASTSPSSAPRPGSGDGGARQPPAAAALMESGPTRARRGRVWIRRGQVRGRWIDGPATRACP
jgi:hypothetical protein